MPKCPMFKEYSNYHDFLDLHNPSPPLPTICLKIFLISTILLESIADPLASI